MRTYWTQMGPNLRTGVLIGKGNLDTNVQTQRENGGRDWSETSTSQGKPRIAGEHQNLARAKVRLFPRAFK